MQRILVVGPPGSGKSTLARILGERLGLRVVHLDTLHWAPGWIEQPRAVFRARVAAAVAQDRWVMDGNYTHTADLRLPRADTVIVLDFPKYVTIPRVIRRWLRYRGRSRPDLTPGCPEKIDLEFIHFMLTRKRGIPFPDVALREYGLHDSLIVLQGPRAANAFLKSF